MLPRNPGSSRLEATKAMQFVPAKDELSLKSYHDIHIQGERTGQRRQVERRWTTFSNDFGRGRYSSPVEHHHHSSSLSSCITVLQLRYHSIDQSAWGDKPHVGQASTDVPRWPLRSRKKVHHSRQGLEFQDLQRILLQHTACRLVISFSGRGRHNFCQTFSIPPNSTWTFR